MKAALEFKATTRQRTGTGGARETRRQGFTPVNVYGAGKTNHALAVETRALSNEYFRGGFMNKVVSLKVDGKDLFTIPRDIQLNPVSDKIEHADFLAVDDKSIVKVKVPVHFLNAEKSVGIKRGGVLNVVSHNVVLLSAVANIPTHIEVDLADVNIGSSVHLNSIALPKGVSPATKRDVTIASITGRSKEEEVDAAAPTAAAAVPASTAKAPEGGAAPAAGAKADAKPAAKK